MATLTFQVARQGDPNAITIWRDTALAIDQGDRVAKWLSDFLQADVRLMAMQEGFERKVDPNFSRSANDIVSFADGYSLLVIAQASLDNLNSKLDRADRHGAVSAEYRRHRLRCHMPKINGGRLRLAVSQ